MTKENHYSPSKMSPDEDGLEKVFQDLHQLADDAIASLIPCSTNGYVHGGRAVCESVINGGYCGVERGKCEFDFQTPIKINKKSNEVE